MFLKFKLKMNCKKFKISKFKYSNSIRYLGSYYFLKNLKKIWIIYLSRYLISEDFRKLLVNQTGCIPPSLKIIQNWYTL